MDQILCQLVHLHLYQMTAPQRFFDDEIQGSFFASLFPFQNVTAQWMPHGSVGNYTVVFQKSVNGFMIISLRTTKT